MMLDGSIAVQVSPVTFVFVVAGLMNVPIFMSVISMETAHGHQDVSRVLVQGHTGRAIPL